MNRNYGWMLLVFLTGASSLMAKDERPNILLYFVDDWGRYASVYADPSKPSLDDVVKTPNFDRIAREGVLFNNAFVTVSSCGPSRAALTTGRHFWTCGSGAFLNGKASDWSGHENPFKTLTKFPDLLRESGYLARKAIKTISFTPSPPTPADKEVPQVKYQRYGLYVSEAQTAEDRQQRIKETLDHPRYEMRRVVKAARHADKPFFFIYGTINVHRPFHPDSGENLWGIDPDRLKGLIPKFLPDVSDVRRDFADYLGEVQAADAMFGVMMEELEAAGQLDNTVIILTGDNGIPGIPRGKTNCYDLSVRAPMMIRWPKKFTAGRTVEDFVSVMDIGPTLLEVAALPVPESMHGRSFLDQLQAKKSGWIEPTRDRVIVGRELHFPSARDGNLPYPMRAVRTKEYLYIRNFKAERWPNGAPYNVEDLDASGNYDRLEESPYRDLDASLTKAWLMKHRLEPEGERFVELTLGRRPPEELYDLRNDPYQLKNLAANPEYARTRASLAAELNSVMTQTADPRMKDDFDRLPYVAPVTEVR